MTWRNAVLYWIVFLAIVMVFKPFEDPGIRVGEDDERQWAVDAFPEEIVAVTLRRNGNEIRARRVGKLWEVVAPEATGLRPDLLERLVASITAREQSVAVVEEHPGPENLAAFGLAPARTMIEFEMRDGRRIHLEIGAPTPSELGVYGRTSLSPRVIVLGLNVSYYLDLAFQRAFPPRPRVDRDAPGPAEASAGP